MSVYVPCDHPREGSYLHESNYPDCAGFVSATTADLVAALIEHGDGKVVEPEWDDVGQVFLPFDGSANGRYLVVRIDGET